MPNRVTTAVAHLSKIADRLLAHARLCRQIAAESRSERVAFDLSRLADECSRVAADVAPEDEKPGRRTH